MNATKRLSVARSDHRESRHFLNPESAKAWAKRESSRALRGLDKEEIAEGVYETLEDPYPCEEHDDYMWMVDT